jgi:hypothetical protein
MRFEVTDDMRRKVKALAGTGLPKQQICALIGLRSVNTLRKHFREELDRAAPEALAKVRQTAFRLATSGRNPRMTLRWLERRAKWRPGMRSRPEAGQVQDYRWVVEEYQPPIPPDDPRWSLALKVHEQAAEEWEGDRIRDADAGR